MRLICLGIMILGNTIDDLFFLCYKSRVSRPVGYTVCSMFFFERHEVITFQDLVDFAQSQHLRLMIMHHMLGGSYVLCEHTDEGTDTVLCFFFSKHDQIDPFDPPVGNKLIRGKVAPLSDEQLGLELSEKQYEYGIARVTHALEQFRNHC